MVSERGGEGALPYLGVGDTDGDVAFGVDGELGADFGDLRERDPRIGLDGGGFGFGELEADEEAAAGSAGQLEEVAASDVSGCNGGAALYVIQAAVLLLGGRRYLR